ncbi:hypothetical protein EDD37DRAFT_174352 [Exophiala viscosa]|uniref:uncharacterized protein n=1 Tax=Exophiala viscosa TaxID=2486360 RepID=UPI0021A00C68|nr:hypothetical protein EDD37DRAFT_174352 [Exophiala viscosa]
MSSPTNNFLSLIPTAHRVAMISGLGSAVNAESVIPALQKTARSSSNSSTESNSVEEPTLPKSLSLGKSPVVLPVEDFKRLVHEFHFHTNVYPRSSFTISLYVTHLCQHHDGVFITYNYSAWGWKQEPLYHLGGERFWKLKQHAICHR